LHLTNHLEDHLREEVSVSVVVDVVRVSSVVLQPALSELQISRHFFPRFRQLGKMQADKVAVQETTKKRLQHKNFRRGQSTHERRRKKRRGKKCRGKVAGKIMKSRGKCYEKVAENVAEKSRKKCCGKVAQKKLRKSRAKMIKSRGKNAAESCGEMMRKKMTLKSHATNVAVATANKMAPPKNVTHIFIHTSEMEEAIRPSSHLQRSRPRGRIPPR
jgi:hypothetical protein